MHQARVVTLSAKLEAGAAQLSDAEAVEMLRTHGIEEPGLLRLIRIAYNCARAGDVFHHGVQRSAGVAASAPHQHPVSGRKIHTDMERGFIRAEGVPWETLAKAASGQAAQDRRLMWVERRTSCRKAT